MNKPKQTPKKKKRIGPPASCDTCLYYDYDELTDSYECQQNLDEDEMVDFLNRQSKECPYYRYYDEYTSVRKQN